MSLTRQVDSSWPKQTPLEKWTLWNGSCSQWKYTYIIHVTSGPREKKDHNKALCKWKFESKTSDRLYVRIEKLDCACIVNEMKKEITYIYTEVYEYNIALKFHSKMTMGNGFQSGRRNKISRGKWQSMQMNEFQVKKKQNTICFWSYGNGQRYECAWRVYVRACDECDRVVYMVD